MIDVRQILNRYTQLRTQGIAVGHVLDVLRDEIDSLNIEDKQWLARRLRAYEAGETLAGGLETVAQTGPLASPDETLPRDAEATWQNIAIQWIICPHCGRQNQKQELICYSCGSLLVTTDGEFQTQKFEGEPGSLPSDDHYGRNCTLVLTARNASGHFEIRPQDSHRELIVGRRTHGTMAPDIDLTSADATRLGVSRMHLSLRYDAEYNTVSIVDTGSANGTFINGQRLHPHEVRVLRHNDELRLGHLVLTVTFRYSE